MKTNKLTVHKLLLAVAVALPLFAVAGANDVDDHSPGMPPCRRGPLSGPAPPGPPGRMPGE